MTLLKLLVTLMFSILMMSCSNKVYPDLSDYNLRDYAKEVACDHDRQCKSIGYGVGYSCGPTYEGGVAGFLIYSTKMGPKNIQRLKNLAKASRRGNKISAKKRMNVFSMAEVQLEECLPIQYSKPKPKCISNQCM